MTRSALLFAVSTALLLLLAAILLWMGLDPSGEEIAKWRHRGY